MVQQGLRQVAEVQRQLGTRPKYNRAVGDVARQALNHFSMQDGMDNRPIIANLTHTTDVRVAKSHCIVQVYAKRNTGTLDTKSIANICRARRSLMINISMMMINAMNASLTKLVSLVIPDIPLKCVKKCCLAVC